MEPANETDCKNENVRDSQEHKEKPSEAASDRESSIESFYTNKSEISNTADSELIDVDDIELSDEESWLYKSPKKLSSAEKQLSTQKWLHKNVEDMDDMELRVTKNALVTKLNQLKLNASDAEKKTTKENLDLENKKTCDKTVKPDIGAESLTATVVELPSIEASKADVPLGDKNEQKPNSVKGKENEVLDVSDVHKIAQLQEESLRQSTSRFLSQTEKKNGQGKHFLIQNPKLSKPASVEALNICNGKLDGESMYSLAPMQNLKKQNHFGSSSLLNKQDAHRSSLPNINPGYYSLRSKKSKRPDPRMAFPLPIYPSPSKLTTNGAVYEAPAYESQRKLVSPLTDYRESRTLPSSYRVNSRSSSTSRRDLSALSPSPRRESASFLPPGARNSPTPNFPRRESAPCNPPKYLSPVSSPTLHQRSSVSPLLLQSPTKQRSRNPPNHLKSPPSAEYHRSTSHSPSRRLPLTTVHNRSPKRGNSPASPRNEEIHAFKLASKIPSPGLRSGIPVPSAYMARVNSDDESWSHDCF